MTPSTDHTQELADTLAVLMGKESPHSVGLDMATFERLYTSALSLLNSHHVAIMREGVYTVSKHNPTWIRRIR